MEAPVLHPHMIGEIYLRRVQTLDTTGLDMLKHHKIDKLHIQGHSKLLLADAAFHRYLQVYVMLCDIIIQLFRFRVEVVEVQVLLEVSSTLWTEARVIGGKCTEDLSQDTVGTAGIATPKC